LSILTAAAGTALVTDDVLAQQCYQNQNQCFAFAPRPEAVGPDDRLATDALQLRSNQLKITGDIRLRLRAAETPGDEPYNANDQQATRARIQFDFQANEKVRAFAEINYSETWAGSGSYSDAQAGPANSPNFNGVSQAYFETDDVLGFGEKLRVGRSDYFLANGYILGSCDFLQRPATFTGAWLSRNFGGHEFEVFVLDDYGPLQSTNDGTRYWGATAKIKICNRNEQTEAAADAEKTEDAEVAEPAGGLLESIRPYILKGTHDGFVESMDTWWGIEGNGTLPADIKWNAEFAHRVRAMNEDISAFRVRVRRNFELFNGVFDGASLVYTESEGALHINPGDFNSAGLLHQYGGAWRSDLTTTQLGLEFNPVYDINLDFNLLHLNRRDASPQQGEYEFDVLASAQLPSGVWATAAYGIDDERRQVAYVQMQVFF
ncbi:MAG: hypothetical protein KDE27_25445, partial [Planctomycetes bacterium]|nr:hypothetical protein [Planctomycetota bacterium]